MNEKIEIEGLKQYDKHVFILYEGEWWFTSRGLWNTVPGNVSFATLRREADLKQISELPTPVATAISIIDMHPIESQPALIEWIRARRDLGACCEMHGALNYTISLHGFS